MTSRAGSVSLADQVLLCFRCSFFFSLSVAEKHSYTPEQVREYEWRVKALASWMSDESYFGFCFLGIGIILSISITHVNPACSFGAHGPSSSSSVISTLLQLRPYVSANHSSRVTPLPSLCGAESRSHFLDGSGRQRWHRQVLSCKGISVPFCVLPAKVAILHGSTTTLALCIVHLESALPAARSPVRVAFPNQSLAL